MTTLFHRHCSDESLIAHLDGELPFYARGRVRSHLLCCWPCRLRLSEIEARILATTRAMEKDTFPGPARVAAARMRFLGQADRIADEVLQPRHSNIRGLAWAAACLLLLCSFGIYKLSRPAPDTTAGTIIKKVEAVAANSARVTTHQRFRVVARQLRPEAVSRESHLEVWSEPARGRFATRFDDSQGVLRHALWQPAPDRQYVFNAARSTTVVKISRSQAEARWDLLRDGVTLEDLEASLLAWLEHRPWSPVSLSSGALALATEDGSTLRMEPAPGAGQDVVRLRASRRSGTVTVEFILDVDRRTYTPQLQSIRYESAARTLELQLSNEPVADSLPASFEPPASFMQAAVPSPAISQPEAIPSPAAPDPYLFDAEIHHALHRIRACLGETIEVLTKPDGQFEVRGVVAGVDRKEQVIAALAPLDSSRLSVDIKSAREVLADIRPEKMAVGQSPLQPSRGRRRQTVRWLSSMMEGNEAQAEEFADRILSAGEDFMREAQALRQLTERFGGRHEYEAGQARWLIDVMAYDHLKDLEAKVESTRHLLQPVLRLTPARPEPVGGGVLRCGAESLRIFALAKNLNERLRALLADGDPGIPEELLVRNIGDAIDSLQPELRAVSARCHGASSGEQK